MTSLAIKFPRNWGFNGYTGHLAFGFILFLYLAVRFQMNSTDPAAVAGIESIWLLIACSGLVFMAVIALCKTLLTKFWSALDLPDLEFMVLHFKSLELWKQLSFYLSLFGLLLLAATGCLMAIC
ncbi:hypothetical protein LPB86_01905 [Pedobacter sp. MC2016-14]|uniref:hypothetical protein n=1 Tax=Pedobacter sp. MC2016-14 TaxID=2897327 RepID=UPI001E44B7AA|nr:hypothetical protein [Pedobacter sp. MC2016-14]MCD0486964.1 hypothetical protein [Pedobacter sp. MC2016-14]